MSQVKWIKLTVSMFDDEKIKIIEALPEADSILIIWIKLLTLAGRINDGGMIYLSEDIPYTDEMLGTIFNRPLNVIRLALKTFQQFGMIEIDDSHLIQIVNWEKHQNIDGLDKIREQTRKRVAAHRERKKQQSIEDKSQEECNVTVTEGNAIEEEREEEDIEREEERDIDKEEEKLSPVPYERIKNLFNTICKSFPKIRSVSSNRKDHLKARWKQFDCKLEVFEMAFQKIENSDFCKGINNRNWKSDFDWLIKNDNNMVKVLEGKYDNEEGGDRDGNNKKSNESKQTAPTEAERLRKIAEQKGYINNLKDEDDIPF